MKRKYIIKEGRDHEEDNGACADADCLFHQWLESSCGAVCIFKDRGFEGWKPENHLLSPPKWCPARRGMKISVGDKEITFEVKKAK